MKNVIVLLLLVTFVLLSFCGCQHFDLRFVDEWLGNKEDALKLPEEMPAEFSFALSWGSEYGSYDSSTGVLKKPYGDKYVTEYAMSEEELRAVYKLIYDLDIFSYADELSDDDYQQVTDVGIYLSLTVNANGLTKTVSAECAYGWYAGKTDKARAYFNTVRAIGDMLEATDEWKSLPPRPYYW